MDWPNGCALTGLSPARHAERAIVSTALTVAAFSADIRSFVEAEVGHVTVELPDWAFWTAFIALSASLAAAVVRRRRHRVETLRTVSDDYRPSRPNLPLPERAHDSPEPPTRLLVRQPGAIHVVDVSSIRWIEADGRYVRLHTSSSRHLAQYTLADLRTRLDRREFVQIHRSTIVNVRCVRALRTSDYRDFDVLLDDGSTLRLSRTFRESLEEALGARL